MQHENILPVYSVHRGRGSFLSLFHPHSCIFLYAASLVSESSNAMPSLSSFSASILCARQTGLCLPWAIFCEARSLPAKQCELDMNFPMKYESGY